MKKDDKTERIWNGKKCLRVTPKEKRIYELMMDNMDSDPFYNDPQGFADLIVEDEMFIDKDKDYDAIILFIERLMNIHFIKTVVE